MNGVLKIQTSESGLQKLIESDLTKYKTVRLSCGLAKYFKPILDILALEKSGLNVIMYWANVDLVDSLGYIRSLVFINYTHESIHRLFEKEFYWQIQRSAVTDVYLDEYENEKRIVQDQVTLANRINKDIVIKDTKVFCRELAYELRINQRQQQYYWGALLCLNRIVKKHIHKDLRHMITRMLPFTAWKEVASRNTRKTTLKSKKTVKIYRKYEKAMRVYAVNEDKIAWIEDRYKEIKSLKTERAENFAIAERCLKKIKKCID